MSRTSSSSSKCQDSGTKWRPLRLITGMTMMTLTSTWVGYMICYISSKIYCTGYYTAYWWRCSPLNNFQDKTGLRLIQLLRSSSCYYYYCAVCGHCGHWLWWVCTNLLLQFLRCTSTFLCDSSMGLVSATVLIIQHWLLTKYQHIFSVWNWHTQNINYIFLFNAHPGTFAWKVD